MNDRSADGPGLEVPDVGPVVDHDAVVVLQPPDQLSVSDVRGDHLAGPAAQQHIGESPGRCAGVEAPTPLHRQATRLERLERTEELVRAS